MNLTTDPARKGYLTSEFQWLAANSFIAYGTLIKIAQDLSQQNSFMTKHPSVAAGISIILIASTAIQSISYTFSRSFVKSAIASTEATTPVTTTTTASGL